MRRIARISGIAWGLTAVAAVAVLVCALNLVIPAARSRSWYAAAVETKRPTPPPPSFPDCSSVWTSKLGPKVIPPPPPEPLPEVAGITLTSDPKTTVAFLNVGAEQRRVHEGDAVAGRHVKRIDREAVVFDEPGGEKTVRVRTR